LKNKKANLLGVFLLKDGREIPEQSYVSVSPLAKVLFAF
jgi:hypothetical protein